MELPSWQAKGRGSMARVALWLESEVGVGKIFTKTQMREAFPEVAQIDRRMRDLRDYGWTIHTHREDPTLKQEEHRYVSRGAEVWIPGQAKAPKDKASLTAAQRSRVMSGDNYLCRSCGIGAGEAFGPGAPGAQLDVARRKVRTPEGAMEMQLVTECNRCRVGGGPRQIDLGRLVTSVQQLSALEKRALAEWMANDRRPASDLEQIWGLYRTLPVESRETIKRALAGQDS